MAEANRAGRAPPSVVPGGREPLAGSSVVADAVQAEHQRLGAAGAQPPPGPAHRGDNTTGTCRRRGGGHQHRRTESSPRSGARTRWPRCADSRTRAGSWRWWGTTWTNNAGRPGPRPRTSAGHGDRVRRGHRGRRGTCSTRCTAFCGSPAMRSSCSRRTKGHQTGRLFCPAPYNVAAALPLAAGRDARPVCSPERRWRSARCSWSATACNCAAFAASARAGRLSRARGRCSTTG